jgi:hypothetical protein
MLSAYIQLIYSLSTIYMIYHVILHHCGTVKQVAVWSLLSLQFRATAMFVILIQGSEFVMMGVVSDDTMFISSFTKIGQLDLHLNVCTTCARTHAQHGPQFQKPIFSFQKESRLGTLRFGVFTAVIIQKDTAFWYVLPCSLVEN